MNYIHTQREGDRKKKEIHTLILTVHYQKEWIDWYINQDEKWYWIKFEIIFFFFWKLNNEFDVSIVLSSKSRSKSFKEFSQQVDYKIKFKSESSLLDEFISKEDDLGFLTRELILFS